MEIDYTYIIRFMKKGMPEFLVKQFEEEGIEYRINEKVMTAKNDTEGVSILKNDSKVIVITIRGTTEIRFLTKFLMTPFDRFSLGIRVELNSKPIGLSAEERSQLTAEYRKIEVYRFNIHQNVVDKATNFFIKFKEDELPDFNIDFSFLKWEILKEEKRNTKNNTLIHTNFPIINYIIGFYREPENMLFSLFFPIILLNLFVLAIFFLSYDDLSSKLGNLATVLLALLAY
jgi:hypothetical protein